VRGGVRLAEGENDLGQKKRNSTKENKTFISRANLSSHTGQPFITHKPAFH